MFGDMMHVTRFAKYKKRIAGPHPIQTTTNLSKRSRRKTCVRRRDDVFGKSVIHSFALTNDGLFVRLSITPARSLFTTSFAFGWVIGVPFALAASHTMFSRSVNLMLQHLVNCSALIRAASFDQAPMTSVTNRTSLPSLSVQPGSAVGTAALIVFASSYRSFSQRSSSPRLLRKMSQVSSLHWADGIRWILSNAPSHPANSGQICFAGQ